MMKLIVLTSVLTVGSLIMSASYAADEVQTQEQAVERAMDQTRTMQSNPGTAQPGMSQNMNQERNQNGQGGGMYQKGPGNGQGSKQQNMNQERHQNGSGNGQGSKQQNMNQERYQHEYQKGPGYGQGSGMNRQGGGMGR